MRGGGGGGERREIGEREAERERERGEIGRGEKCRRE